MGRGRPGSPQHGVPGPPPCGTNKQRRRPTANARNLRECLPHVQKGLQTIAFRPLIGRLQLVHSVWVRTAKMGCLPHVEG
eukprot:scaffold91274_cov15-Tisochrysis_lutea.AAC.1